MTGNPAWAHDTWRRFCTGYGEIVLDDKAALPPADLNDQLREAIDAVFRSWTNDRVAAYRRGHGLGAYGGTAPTVQAMVFGNRDEHSGTGVVFSRDPATGERKLFGECLSRAQGQDVVSGGRTPETITQFAAHDPELYRQFAGTGEIIEQNTATSPTSSSPSNPDVSTCCNAARANGRHVRRCVLRWNWCTRA